MKTILSFNGSSFFEENSSATLKQIALTLMYFGESQETPEEKQKKIKFVIEAKEEKRETLNAFLKTHGLKSSEYLDPYIPEFFEVSLDNSSSTPIKRRSSSLDETFESPASITSSPSILEDPKEIQKQDFANKIQDLNHKLKEKLNGKFHFFHLDQDEKYDAGPITQKEEDESNISCFVVKNIGNESKEMLGTAAQAIGLKQYVQSLTGNKTVIFKGKKNEDLLRDLAAIRYLLQINQGDDLEKLKKLVIAFHQHYDIYLKGRQRDDLSILITQRFGNSFISRNLKTKEQWRSDRDRMKAFAKTKKTKEINIEKVAYITHNLFPYYPETLKEHFLNKTLSQENIEKLVQKETKFPHEKELPKRKQLSTAIRTELLDVITVQSNIFFQIPIIGRLLNWINSFRNAPLSQLAYPSVGIYKKPAPAPAPTPIPFLDNPKNTRYKKPTYSRWLLFDTYFPNLASKEKATLENHTKIFAGR